MVMLCLQTSCHRCPSALHNRLVTSTPSLSPLSLIHHVRVDASSVKEAPAPVARGPTSREKRVSSQNANNELQRLRLGQVMDTVRYRAAIRAWGRGSSQKASDAALA